MVEMEVEEKAKCMLLSRAEVGSHRFQPLQHIRYVLDGPRCLSHFPRAVAVSVVVVVAVAVAIRASAVPVMFSGRCLTR